MSDGTMSRPTGLMEQANAQPARVTAGAPGVPRDADGNPLPQYGDQDIPPANVIGPAEISGFTRVGSELRIIPGSSHAEEQRVARVMEADSVEALRGSVGELMIRVERVERILRVMADGSLRSHPELTDAVAELHQAMMQ